MKRIILVRHAKAVPYGYDEDFTRDLTDRGLNDAERIGKELHQMGIKPELMISSPANRAIQTAYIIADKIGFDKKKIRELPEIYDGMTSANFLKVIHDLPDHAETVIFFGHNPAFLYYVSSLTSAFPDDMPTCSVVGIDFQTSEWSKIESRTGEKAFHLFPKMFRQ